MGWTMDFARTESAGLLALLALGACASSDSGAKGSPGTTCCSCLCSSSSSTYSCTSETTVESNRSLDCDSECGKACSSAGCPLRSAVACGSTPVPGGDAGGGGPEDAWVPKPVQCSGAFGPAVLVSDDPGPAVSPAIVGDELEIFYLRGPSLSEEIVSARRPSIDAPFPVATRDDALMSVCADWGGAQGIDVTPDGLRAYLTCRSSGGPSPPLRLASRSTRTSAFSGRRDVGRVGLSPSIDGSELRVYAYDSQSSKARPVVAARASTAESFADPQPVPGLESSDLIAPGVSHDDLVLFGAIDPKRIAQASRASPLDPFGPLVDIPVNADLDAWGSVDPTQDCRALYLVGVKSGAQRLYVMRR